VSGPKKGKKRAKIRRGAWPPYRPAWLPDDDPWLRGALRAVQLRSIPQRMRSCSNRSDWLALADELKILLEQPLAARTKLEKRQLDAERIAERVAEIKNHLKQNGHPQPAMWAWQIVANELELVARGAQRAFDEAVARGKHSVETWERAHDELAATGVVAPEGKALRRWVERNL
jgi:hypothetical protein